MTKIIKIDRCNHCPYERQEGAVASFNYCSLIEKSVTDNGIDVNCPLKDIIKFCDNCKHQYDSSMYDCGRCENKSRWSYNEKL